MITRYDGLTPDDINQYPSLSMIQFLNPLNHTSGGAATTITDLSFTVPTGLKISLPFIIHGNPTNTSNFQCRTASGGGGTLYSVIMGAGSPSAMQVHVEPGTGMLLFHSSASGVTLYVTMKSIMSHLDASYFAWLHANCVRMQTVTLGGGETYTAGEAVVIGPGYVADDGLLYQADPSDYSKVATLFITQSVSAGNSAVVQRTGNVTPKRGMPGNRDIWAGRGGEVTWIGDDDPSYKLETNDYQQFLGKSSHDGLSLALNVNVPITRYAE